MNTSYKTHEIAAFLISRGANPLIIKKFFMQDLSKYKKKLEAIYNLEIIKKNIAIAIVNDRSIVASLSDELLNIKNIKASFVVFIAKKKIIISARSTGNINTQKIMQEFNGGGHINSSAAQINSDNPKKIIDLLKDSIIKNIN
jgi:c-di-AMP phosphodiesterase-like protein